MAIATDPGIADARESAFWRAALGVLFRSAPMPVMRAVRKHVRASPVEEFLIVGRRTGRERRMLLGLFDIDGTWYAGNPNGTAQWIRNLEAAGGCTVIRRDGIPIQVRATEVTDAALREAVIRKTGTQPLPAGLVYRRARRHIRAVGRYYRLERVASASEATPSAAAGDPTGAGHAAR